MWLFNRKFSIILPEICPINFRQAINMFIRLEKYSIARREKMNFHCNEGWSDLKTWCSCWLRLRCLVKWLQKFIRIRCHRWRDNPHTSPGRTACFICGAVIIRAEERSEIKYYKSLFLFFYFFTNLKSLDACFCLSDVWEDCMIFTLSLSKDILSNRFSLTDKKGYT